MPRSGWLQRQFTEVREDIKTWPAWMRREAGITEREPTMNPTPELHKPPEDRRSEEAKQRHLEKSMNDVYEAAQLVIHGEVKDLSRNLGRLALAVRRAEEPDFIGELEERLKRPHTMEDVFHVVEKILGRGYDYTEIRDTRGLVMEPTTLEEDPHDLFHSDAFTLDDMFILDTIGMQLTGAEPWERVVKESPPEDIGHRRSNPTFEVVTPEGTTRAQEQDEHLRKRILDGDPALQEQVATAHDKEQEVFDQSVAPSIMAAVPVMVASVAPSVY